jgi:hypothetical protein
MRRMPMTAVHGVRRRHRTHAVATRPAQPVAEPKERPLWQTITLLYAGIVVLAAVMMTLAFVLAKLITGAAY